MTKAIALMVIISASCMGCSKPEVSGERGVLLESLRPYVSQITNEMDKIPSERRAVLTRIAETIVARVAARKDSNLTFICTHNSRRSHMSQLWAQAAAHYYGLDSVYSFSGGTETTACDVRTVHALRNAGFSVAKATTGENPEYLIKYSNERDPMQVYSKPYDADDNPKKDFIALMCCSKADRMCPVVRGASSRYAIHYADPKLCDNTPEERSVYEASCREIAREMFYMMSEVRERVGG